MNTSTPPPRAIHIHAKPLSIPFKFAFTQASKRRDSSEAVAVVVERGGVRGLGEGCPRPYQTGETQTSALAWIAGLSPSDFNDLEAVRGFAKAPLEHPAAWCAVEAALLDLFAREARVSVEALLGQPEQPRRFRYTTVLGMRPGPALLDRVVGFGLSDFKLKVGNDLERDRELIVALRERIPDARIRFDVNNAFGRDPEAAARHLGALAGAWAIEEPLAAGLPAETAALGRSLGLPIILDEAILGRRDIEAHAAHDAEWIVNIKVSRVGGLLRALELVSVARSAGWGIIVGAQAGESSLLTRAGQIVARAAGDALRGHEGAIGAHLLESEPYAQTLDYGRGGWLDLDACGLEPIGWGLTELER